MLRQGSLFPDDGPEDLEKCEADEIMAKLKKLTRLGYKMNEMLKNMIDDLQQDWSEDEKLRINDPDAYYKKQQETEKPMTKELSAEAIEWLKGCTIDEKIVRLPDNGYNRPVYQEVKNRMELIGGKWKGGKIAGFVFDHDPSELLAEIATGVKRNLKKEFQFFGTPAALADRLVELAEIEEGMVCLEPSAGRFAIGEAIYRKFPRAMDGPNDQPCVTVDYYELMPQNSDIISQKLHANKNWLSRSSCMGDDFLKAKPGKFLYDRVIANPPFSKNQDIDHIQHMYRFLKPGGRLVSIASRHWQISANKKECSFECWLDELNAQIIDIDAGEFKESGTTVATCIIIIDKK
jgi:hypothetical protein